MEKVTIKYNGKMVDAKVLNTEPSRECNYYEIEFEYKGKKINTVVTDFQLVDKRTGMSPDDEMCEINQMMMG